MNSAGWYAYSTWLPILLPFRQLNTGNLPLTSKQVAWWRIQPFVWRLAKQKHIQVSVSAPTLTHKGMLAQFLHSQAHRLYTLTQSVPLTLPSISALKHTQLIICLCTDSACRHLFGSVWLAGILCVGLFVPEEQRAFYWSNECDSHFLLLYLMSSGLLLSDCVSQLEHE